MNRKLFGEIGERIAIGELAKYGIDVILPLTDNLPFDLVVFYHNKFFKCQVKTSTKITKLGSLSFSITSNNWYKGTTHFYTKEEVDVWILCDGNTIYLLRFDENNCKNCITLRNSQPKNNQLKGVKYMKDFILSKDRIEKVFS